MTSLQPTKFTNLVKEESGLLVSNTEQLFGVVGSPLRNAALLVIHTRSLPLSRSRHRISVKTEMSTPTPEHRYMLHGHQPHDTAGADAENGQCG